MKKKFLKEIIRMAKRRYESKTHINHKRTCQAVYIPFCIQKTTEPVSIEDKSAEMKVCRIWAKHFKLPERARPSVILSPLLQCSTRWQSGGCNIFRC